MREVGETLLGRFRLVELIGPGGPTELWLAEDLELGERLAVRILAAALEGEAGRELLRAECRRARRLGHPGIARVYDFHSDGETSFLTRAYVEGSDASALRGRTPEEVAAAVRPLLAALRYAHDQGLVHGDLKASKVIVEQGRTTVIDFALATGLTRLAEDSLEARDSSHLSPQIRAGDTPAPADDIYSLGVLLAELLAPDGAAELPAGLSALIYQMRANARDDRPRGIAAVESALASFTQQQTPAVSLALGAAPAPRPTPQPTQPSSRNTVAIALGGMVILALLVLFVLPRWAPTPGDEPRPTQSTPEAESAPAADGPGAAALRIEAEKVLAQLMAPRQRLLDRGVEQWASESFAGAARQEALGDEALVAADYATARDRYREALTVFETLEADVEGALARTLEAGDVALRAGDSAEALSQFELAQRIDPENAAAQHGSARARNLDQVLAHMAAGSELESAGELVAAREEYARALELDPEWEPASQSEQRTRQRIEDEAFDDHLSNALLGLAAGELKTARSELVQARALRPDSPEVADALAQLRQAETTRQIALLRARAEKQERNEQWRAALASYRAILKIDARVLLAQQGAERTEELAKTEERMDQLLGDPTQLFSRATRSETERLIARGRELETGRSRYAARVEKLSVAMRLASTPLPVVIESDSLTEVLIQRVGVLGSFDRHQILLKPGTYVVLGRRDGYRDVRQSVSVVPGIPLATIVVRCTEEI